MQRSGPETGLQERARQSEIQAYYDDILHRRFLGSGRVTFLGGSDYHAEASSHLVTSRVSGETVQVDVRRRVVDTTYLSPTIPVTTPPPFNVADDVHVAAINELARLTAAPSSYVIVGSGKTATDGILDDGSVSLVPSSLIVHCAASGLQYPRWFPSGAPDSASICLRRRPRRDDACSGSAWSRA